MGTTLRLAIFLYALALFAACTYNPDTVVTADGEADGDAGIAIEDCDGFVSQPCRDCGSLVCNGGDDGAQVSCVGDEQFRSCAEGSCTADGYCESVFECEPGGLPRPCGECAWEFCSDQGQWSGECVPDSSLCYDDDELCLQDDGPNDFECTEGCTTFEWDTPCEDEDEIPAQVPVGYAWNARNECGEDKCRECKCVKKFGQVYVRCSLFCDDD
jgi:hypothetical protein